MQISKPHSKNYKFQSPSKLGGMGGDLSPQSMLAVQQQTDHEQEALTLASNLQKKAHDTIMAIIANIK